MSHRPNLAGFESETRKPERRDFFDLRRRLAVLEHADSSSGSGSADIDGGDPSGSGTGFIDGGGI